MYSREIKEEIELFMCQNKEHNSLKILLLVDELTIWGGLETYILTLTKELAKIGHKVYLCTNKINNGMLKSVQIHNVYNIENPTFNDLVNLSIQEKIDIIHAQPYGSSKKAHNLHNETKIPFVVTCHSPLFMEYNPFTVECINSAYKVIAISEETANALRINYPSCKNKIVVIQNGVEISESLEESPELKESLTLLFIGRLQDERAKGVEKLISTYQNSSFSSLIICGDGNKKELLKTKFSDDNSIRFIGETSNVKDLILKSDVVVATGRGIRESLALEKPCIVLSSWGYDGLIRPNVLDKMEYSNFSGRAFNSPFNPDDLLRDLKILEDSSLRKSLGIWGRNVVSDRYSIEKTTEKLVILYEQAINSNNVPAISIILPVYNQSSFLTAAIKSILDQTYSNFELIIINDGSTDNFKDVISTFTDSRIRVISNASNMKLPYSINKGLLSAQGKYITWTSADNLLLPNFLEEIVNALEKNPLCGSAYSDYIQIDSDDKFIKVLSKGLYKLDGRTNFGPSFLYRRNTIQNAGFFDESLFGVEDRDYSIRVAIEAPVLWISKALYKYKVHDDSLTGRHIRNEIDFSNSTTKFKDKWSYLLNYKNIPALNSTTKYKKEYIILSQKNCNIRSNSNTNQNTEPLFVGNYKGIQYYSLLYFDLCEIPDDEMIIDAKIELFIIRDDNSQESSFYVKPLFNDWEETTVTNLASLKTTMKDFVIGKTSGIFSYMTIDISSIVNKWVTKHINNYGLLLSSSNFTKVFATYNRHYYLKPLTPRLKIITTGKTRGIKYS